MPLRACAPALSPQARRIRVSGAKYCPFCRIGGNRVSEEDRLFWLSWAGCQVPEGMTAAEYIAEHGLPDAIAALAGELWPELRRPDDNVNVAA